VERRLTTILAADVVGYSRLMETDEAGTLAALKSHRKELIDPNVAEHHGRIFKLMGDGALVEFASVVDAVASAVAIQEGMIERNKEMPEDRRIEFRIGVHLGDVMVEGDDLYGDGVNVAARLEGLAEPGGICISQQTFDQVETKLDSPYEDLGELQVKNMLRPVHVYRVVLDGQSQDPDIASSQKHASRRRWIVGVGIITFLAAGGIFAWAASDLGQSDSPEAICTDHLGLPVPAEVCAENQE
jgi:class 3 adenylate cyclase